MNKPMHEVGKAIADFFAAGERDDLMLLYFSGHGLKDDNGRLYLAMRNTVRGSLRFTALSAQSVQETVSESRPRQTILVLDCCYSGAYAAEQFTKSDSAVHTKEAFGGRGRIVLTASDSTQYAFEGTESVFTHHLVEGLRTGAADVDADGGITTDELYDYTYKAVTAERPNQRPRQFAEIEGRTVVASNPHWTLPDYLVSAINSSIPEIRQTALAPLGQLLQANNEMVRRTAREQLELLRDGDSRSIAATAQAYLDSPPPPVRQQPVATQTVRRSHGPTFGAAARATARRWRGRFSLPEWDWPIVGLALLAAAAQVVCVVVATPRIWQMIVIAVLAVLAVLVAIRLRANAAAFAVGLAGPALLAAAQAVAWITHEFLIGMDPLPAAWYLTACVAWLAAGAIGLFRLRRTPPRPHGTAQRPGSARCHGGHPAAGHPALRRPAQQGGYAPRDSAVSADSRDGDRGAVALVQPRVLGGLGAERLRGPVRLPAIRAPHRCTGPRRNRPARGLARARRRNGAVEPAGQVTRPPSDRGRSPRAGCPRRHDGRRRTSGASAAAGRRPCDQP
jgi:hypothetical protein